MNDEDKPVPDAQENGNEGPPSDLDEVRPGEEIADADPLALVSCINVQTPEQADLIIGMLKAESVPAATEMGSVHSMTEGMDATALNGIDVLVPARYLRLARRVLAKTGILSDVRVAEVEKWLSERVEPLLEGAQSKASATTELVKDLREKSEEFFAHVTTRLLEKGKAGLDLVKSLLRDALSLGEENPLVYELPKLLAKAREKTGLDEGGIASLLVQFAGEAKEPETRVNLARALGSVGKASASHLIRMLEDAAGTVRDEALESLYFISNGFDFDFDPEGPESERKEGVSRWRAWLARGAQRRGD